MTAKKTTRAKPAVKPSRPPLSLEYVGVTAQLEFLVREGGVVVDRGTATAPPIFTPTQLRRWLSRTERQLLEQWRKQRDAQT